MKTEKHYLSKSTYIRGLQCLKSLYLYKKRYFLRDRLSRLQMAKFKRGHQIGHLARQRWPGGIDLSPGSPSQYQKSVARTMELIHFEQAEVIYEATFQFKQVLVMMDILVKEASGWVAYEVKSSLQVSDTYLEDAALQYYIITAAGVHLRDIRIMHLNPDYRREEEVDIGKLFRCESVMEFAKGRRHFIEQNIESMLTIKNLESSPNIPIGNHCFKPYDCDFIGHCWKSQKHPEQERLDYWANAWKNAGAANASNSDREQPSLYIAFISTKPAIPVLIGNKPFQALPVGIGIYDTQNNTSEIFIASFPEYNPEALIDIVLQYTESYASICVEDKAIFDTLVDSLINKHPENASNLIGIKNRTFGLKELIKGNLHPEIMIYDTSFPGALRLAAHLQLKTASDQGKIDDAALAGEVYRLLYFSDQTERDYQRIDLEKFLKSHCEALAVLAEKLR